MAKGERKNGTERRGEERSQERREEKARRGGEARVVCVCDLLRVF
jgi:hypothetical protein